MRGIIHSYSSSPFISIAIILILLIYSTYSCEKLEPKRIIAIKTGQATEVMATTAKVTGEIIDAGEGIDQHGICWSISPNPTTSNSSVSQLGPRNNGGNFTYKIQGLNPNTTYYARVYATGSSTTSYGNQINFKTQFGSLQFYLDSVAINTQWSSVFAYSYISELGAYNIQSFGFCWNTSRNPTISDSKYEVFGTPNLGINAGSISSLSSLDSNSIYFIKAFIVDEINIIYSNEIEFILSCGYFRRPRHFTGACTDCHSTDWLISEGYY